MLALTMNQAPQSVDTCYYNIDEIDFVDEIEIMKQKEDNEYKCGDYALRRNLEQMTISTSSVSMSSMSTHTKPCKYTKMVNNNVEINSSCRTTMCEWCFRVVDHFGARRELVEIAMNYLDRLLNKFNCDRTAYKLACITSMYLAIKLFNKKTLGIASLSTLSKGEFSIAHITEMENFILRALAWNLHPPTSVNFIYYFHTLLPSIKDSAKQTIIQRSCFFAELAVMDYYFVTHNASETAFSAILNAMDGLEISFFSEEKRSAYILAVENVSSLDHTSKIIIAAREKMWNLYEKSAQFQLHDNQILPEGEITEVNTSH